MPGLPWSSNGLLECYRVGAEAFGWARRPHTPGTLSDGRHRLGWGMAAACYPAYRIASQAAVAIGADGRVKVRCGTQDMGSGTYTVLAQLAAEALGVPYAAVDVALGDTLLPEGPYSGGSMATASFTPAVEDAARQLRRDLIARAVADPRSPLHGQQPDQVSVEGGVMRAGNRSESFADLVARVAPQGLEAAAAAAPHAKPATQLLRLRRGVRRGGRRPRPRRGARDAPRPAPMPPGASSTRCLLEASSSAGSYGASAWRCTRRR